MLSKKKITTSFSYDKDADVMYITFGNAEKCTSVESNVLVRFNPFTKEINGITIIGYKEMYENKNNPSDISS